MRPQESIMQYPTDLPITEVQGLISTIRSNSIVTNKTAFAKQLWIVQGYVQGVLLGDTVDAKASMPPRELTDEEVCDILEQAIQNTDPAVMQAFPIPWSSILTWALKLALALLM